jgi:hypothetical protein
MLWLLATLCLLIALFSRASFFTQPFDSDSSMFIYAGKVAAQGQSLCRDFIDNKLPTVGLMMSAPWRLAGRDWPAYLLMQTAMALATTTILWRTARKHIGPDAAIATGLFALVYLNLNCVVFGGFQLETPQALLATIAAAAAMDALAGLDVRDALLVGLAAAAAALLKPTGLAALAAFLGCILAAALAKHTMPLGTAASLIVAALIGAAIPTAVACIYITGTSDWSNLAPRLAQIASYAKHSAWDSSADWVKPIVIAVFPGFPLLVRWGVCRGQDRRNTERAPALLVSFALLWFILEIIGIVAQRRMYAYHFMTLAPPVALLFGMIPRKAQVAPLAAALLPALLISASGSAQRIGAQFRWSDTLEATDYLATHATPGDAVWQDDAGRLLIETGLQPGSRVILTFLFGNDDQAPLKLGHIIVSDLTQRRPRWVLLPTRFERFVNLYVNGNLELSRNPARGQNFKTAWREIHAYTLAHYRPVAYAWSSTIYERIDSPDTASARLPEK